MRWLWCLALLAACAHTPNLPLRPDPSPPEGSTTDTFVARDGTQLLSRHWAAQGDTHAVVVIMHGLKDYSARYAHFASRLSAAGYSVYAFDLRGHARSAGKRVAPDSWNDYVDDLDRFLTSVEQKEPGKKVYLFGHSMGGAIATVTAERHTPKLAGLMLSAPALAVDAPPLQLAAAAMAGVLTPKFPALELPNKNFSSDPNAKAVMDKDEMVSQVPAPASTAAALIEMIAAAWEGSAALTMPVIAVHGSSDKVTAPAGSRMLIKEIASPDKQLKIYEGAYHDLLHEPDGRAQMVETDLIAWLDGHEGGTAVAADPPYQKRLAGRPRGWAQAIEVAGGIGEDSTFAGRLAVEMARPRPVGWHGAFVAQRIGGLTAIELQPAGVAVRSNAIVVGVSGGGSLVGPQDGHTLAFALSGGAWAEVPVGPVHLGLYGQLDHPLGSDSGVQYELGGASLRLGRDKPYWPHAHAGVGPMVSGGVLRAATDAVSGTAWFLMVGLQLYGAD